MLSFYEERKLQREWEKKERTRLIDEYMQKLRAKRLEKEEQVRIQELRRQQEYEREFQRQEVARGLQEILGMMRRFQEENAIRAEQRQKESDQFIKKLWEDVRITDHKAKEKRDAQIKQAKEKRDAQMKLNVVQLDKKNVVHEIFDDDVCDDDSSIHSNDALLEMETMQLDNSLMKKETVIDVIEPSMEEFVESPCVIVDIVEETEQVDTVIEEVGEIEEVIVESYVSEIDNSDDLLAQRKDLKAYHVYFDPFLVHDHPFNSVIADLYALPNHTYERTTPAMFTCLHFVVGTSGMAILTYDRPRLVFDPGRFEDESF